MEVQRSRLLRALVHVVQMVDQPDELVPVPRAAGPRPPQVRGVRRALRRGRRRAARRRSARSPARPGPPRWRRPGPTPTASSPAPCAPRPTPSAGPASWMGRVCEHRRIGWDLALITVQTSEPIPYRAGQYVSVETPQRPRLWRYLSPANAPRADGTLEFHVRAVSSGWVSRAIVAHSKVGRHLADRPADGPDAASTRTSGPRRADGRRRHRDGADQGAARGPRPAAAPSRRTQVFVGGRTWEDLYDFARAAQALLPQPLAGRRPGGGEGRVGVRAPSAARWPTWSPATARGPTTTCWSAARRR